MHTHTHTAMALLLVGKDTGNPVGYFIFLGKASAFEETA